MQCNKHGTPGEKAVYSLKESFLSGKAASEHGSTCWHQLQFYAVATR